MKRILPLVAVAALSLAACKQAQDAHRPPSAPPPSTAADNATATAAPSPPPDAFPAKDAEIPTAPLPAPVLAMAYKLGLVVPTDQVRTLMESHQEACERAGPEQCQVLGAHASADGADQATADLSLRATPAWMRMFRTRAEADAKDLGGRIDEAATEGDDLSAQIAAAEAAQASREAERQRLTGVMQHSARSYDESQEAQQQITQVQSDMDQAASALAALKGRVAMQTLTVSYQSAAAATPRGVTAPLAEASRGFVANAIQVLAFLLNVSSVLLPLGLVAAPVGWWVWRQRRAKGRTAAPTAAPRLSEGA